MFGFQKDAHRTSLLTLANFFIPTKQSITATFQRFLITKFN